MHQTESEIPKLLNSWGGWLCGWYEKENFDMGVFLPNVTRVLETRRTFEEGFSALEDEQGARQANIPEKWTIGELFQILSHLRIQDLGVIITVATLLLSLAFSIGLRLHELIDWSIM